MSKLLASLMRNYFPKRPSGAPLHTLSKLYDVPVGFVPPPPILRLNNCLFCGRRRVAVARCRMICLVLPRSQYSLTAYLPVWFPYRFNSSVTFTLRCHSPDMKHKKTVANIFQRKTPVTWPKTNFDFFRLLVVICRLSIKIRIELHFCYSLHKIYTWPVSFYFPMKT